MVNKLASRIARTRLSFIVALLLVPMTVLGYLASTQMQSDINFAERELTGLALNQKLMPLMFDIAASDRKPASEKVFIESAGPLADQLGLRVELELFTGLLKSPSTGSAELLAAAADLKDKAADRSNLILDPFGESYHLAALTTVNIADLVIDTAAFNAALEEAHGSIAGLRGHTGELALRLGGLTKAANQAVASLSSASRWAESPKTYEVLLKSAEHLEHDPGELAGTLIRAASASSGADYGAISSIANELTNHIFSESREVWTQGSGRLQALLSGRVERLRQLHFLMLAGSIAAAVVALATAAFMFGSTLSKLDEVEAAYKQAQAARNEAEDMSLKLQAINSEITNLNRDLAENVGRLQEAQEEIVKRGKMAQLGQLVATVAHELRNPLGAVRTSVFLLQRKVKDKVPDVETQFMRINNGILRCDNIITQLLDFSRTKQLKSEPVVFDDWVAQTVEEEAAKLPPQVAIECDLGLGSIQVPIDSERMRRAIVNLLNNASEAMVGKGESPSQQVTASPRIAVITRLGARGAEITVADNGPGMTEEVMGKVLEPLFTTKNFGTGLGLPAVEKIAEQHGGGLSIASRPGAGASFTVWIPIKQTHKEAA